MMNRSQAEDRVLIIDDDEAMRRMMRRMAEAAGFAVKATGDPVLFKEDLASWLPTLVILDLQMPGRDGIQILADLGAEHCDAQVVLATGADARTLDAALRLGRERGVKMAGTLQKPFRLETVRELLERLKTLPPPSPGELAEAISAGQLFLEYQPKLDCRRGRVTGVEALVRWHHPSRGRIEPDDFISLAEEHGLIDPLTDWVFTAGIKQAAAWHASGVFLDVAMNVSAINLDHADLPDRLARDCDEHALDREAVIIEVTESCAMHDPLRTLEVLTRLRIKGFRLSMDDFGTAYSSLVQLQRMPFSELKIDRSFVINLARDDSCKAIARIIVDLARNLGIRSVAEGVEQEEAWAALCAMGCDAVQGYHLGRPMSAGHIVSLIETGALRPELRPIAS